MTELLGMLAVGAMPFACAGLMIGAARLSLRGSK